MRGNHPRLDEIKLGKTGPQVGLLALAVGFDRGVFALMTKKLFLMQIFA